MPRLTSRVNTCSRVDMKNLSARTAQTTYTPHTVRPIFNKITLRCFTKITEFLNRAERRMFPACLFEMSKCPVLPSMSQKPMNDVIFTTALLKAKREVPSRAKSVRQDGSAPRTILHPDTLRGCRQTRIVRVRKHTDAGRLLKSHSSDIISGHVYVQRFE